MEIEKRSYTATFKYNNGPFKNYFEQKQKITNYCLIHFQITTITPVDKYIQLPTYPFEFLSLYKYGFRHKSADESALLIWLSSVYNSIHNVNVLFQCLRKIFLSSGNACCSQGIFWCEQCRLQQKYVRGKNCCHEMISGEFEMRSNTFFKNST